MKTFEDLKFKAHPIGGYFMNQAVMEFKNGYGISVINGHLAYCDDETYEVGILYGGDLTYNTHLTDDVLTYQTKEDINNIIKEVKAL